MTDVNDLDVLTKQDEALNLGGQVVILNRIRIGQLADVLAAVQPIASLLMHKVRESRGPDQELSASSIDVPGLLTRHSDAVIDLITTIQGRGQHFDLTREWVADLELDEMIILTTRVLETNLDFFIQRVLPELSRALGAINAAVQLKVLGGSTPSKP